MTRLNCNWCFASTQLVDQGCGCGESVTPDGFPLAYEVMNGNTADCSTLRGFLAKIEAAYGKARRVWVMDRGIPSEAILQEMRDPERQTFYLVGTPKGRIQQHEKKCSICRGRKFATRWR